ncbi:hypothetical protein HYH03_004404 [Edaphochlamys debaryana]|uniref:Uncharacterized protein n=1 Tax=Edaphochlamys debaryana TaxID=47281 RepID=A0A836C2B4_9CHLO|nr:hypothetical protein HYH03_004404 [Edaphochlamys debaryana]|eukprot:KAG2497665.1 hypothetical protein HYH03_004404 [Edaphochlamys debaryana]
MMDFGHTTYGHNSAERFYSAVRQAQAETVRQELERSSHVEDTDIERAWSVLVPSGEPSVSKSDLVDRLSSYLPHVDSSAVNHLVGGAGSMSLERLTRMLWQDGQPTLPCNMSEEAWKLLDPHGRGSIGLDTLLRMLTTIEGCEKLDPDDMRVIRNLLDLSTDDYVIAERNWAQLGCWTPMLEEVTPAQRKMLAARASAQAAKAAAAANRRPAGGRRSPAPPAAW